MKAFGRAMPSESKQNNRDLEEQGAVPRWLCQTRFEMLRRDGRGRVLHTAHTVMDRGGDRLDQLLSSARGNSTNQVLSLHSFLAIHHLVFFHIRLLTRPRRRHPLAYLGLLTFSLHHPNPIQLCATARTVCFSSIPGHFHLIF